MGLLNFFKKDTKKDTKKLSSHLDVDFFPAWDWEKTEEQIMQEQQGERKRTPMSLEDYVKSGLFEQEMGTVLHPIPREEALKILEQMEKAAAERRAKGID